MMNIKIAQLNIDRSLSVNKNKIINILQQAKKNDWILFPECALTGYFPEEKQFIQAFDSQKVTQAIDEITELVKAKQCYCLLGTARYYEGAWFNAVALLSPSGIVDYYHKFAITNNDKKYFSAGKQLNTYKMGGVTFGVQICRDLVFPEQWQALKKKGAQIIFQANNAIKPYDDVWEHLVVARAVENQLFVASANNCASPGELTSYLVAPSGKQILKAAKQQEELLSARIDLVNHDSPYEYVPSGNFV